MGTATTRHILDVTVEIPGDDAIDPQYLIDVLMWGLEQHNLKVIKHRDNPRLIDHEVTPLEMSASPDIGLDAEDVAFCHEHDNDFAYFPVSESSLRASNDENNWEPYVDAGQGVPPLLRF